MDIPRPARAAGLLATLALLGLPTLASASWTHRGGSGRHGHHRALTHRQIHRHHHLFLRARGGVCPYANLTPSHRDIELVRAATLCLVNRERAAHGEQPLRWNNRLIGAAQGHTTSMAFGNYFAHTGPGGQTALGRLRHAGYISSRSGYEVGENIAWGTLWLATPRSIVAGWMASAGHRANILDPRYRETGIGVSPHPPAAFSHGARGGIYTEDFGVITRG